MKDSLLKYLSCLYKGTTWGYATRKDCIVTAVFFVLINSVLALLHFLTGYIIGLQERILIRQIENIPSYLFWMTIIANCSLFFMRINDIFGKRCFTTKKHIFVFIFAFIAIILLLSILKITILGLWLDSWFILLLCIILCVYPSSPSEREDMPAVDYKLPKKTIAAMLFVIFIGLSAMLYGIVLFCRNASEYGFDCNFLR
jgi:uncharacterized membrane protein YfcA